MDHGKGAGTTEPAPVGPPAAGDSDSDAGRPICCTAKSYLSTITHLGFGASKSCRCKGPLAQSHKAKQHGPLNYDSLPQWSRASRTRIGPPRDGSALAMPVFTIKTGPGGQKPDSDLRLR